ncbi:MAG: hypothetical protein ACRDJC_10890 [Thermomicrobiales bacterium]
MPSHQPESRPHTGFVHRLLERLTAIKTHTWLLRRRLRRGALDPAAAEVHLEQIDAHVDETTALAANLQGKGPPPS